MTRLVDTTRIRPPRNALELLEARQARSIGAIPLTLSGRKAVICVADAADGDAARRLAELLPDLEIEIAEAADPAEFVQALKRTYPDDSSRLDAAALFSRILSAARAANASDIHISPGENGASVLLRIDGRLVRSLDLHTPAAEELVSHIKVLASLDIAEKRAPQDGNISSAAASMRVATIPTIHGEHATIRLLPDADGRLDSIRSLGLHPRQLALLENALARQDGAIVLSGPTGSGKTTTLYAALRHLCATGDLHIVSIEDPVEKPVAGVTQVKVDSRSGKIGFANALRSVLRHDPDAIMIGEIRDPETASTALRAAMTGHLVLTTLHTNSAPGILERLVDLGAPAYLVSSTMRLAVAQRLLRRPCRECMTLEPAPAALCRLFGWSEEQPPEIPVAHGCAYCGGTGYSGRTAIYEMMAVDGAVRRLLASGARENELYDLLRKNSPDLTLEGDALAKLLEGETTLDECRRAIGGVFLEAAL